MKDSSQSNSNLKQILEIMKEVVIICFYKGFPIACKSIFHNLQGDQIVFKVSPPDSVCLIASKHAWILGGELFEALKVNINSFDITTGILEVANPTYAGIKFGNRKVARVEPDQETPISIKLEESGETAHGTLVDISLGGAGILLKSGENLSIIPGAPVTVKIYLPYQPDNKPVEISAKIINRARTYLVNSQNTASSTQADTPRFSISFTNSMLAKTPILAYIAHRRSQLMKEVRSLYEIEIDRHRHS